MVTATAAGEDRAGQGIDRPDPEHYGTFWVDGKMETRPDRPAVCENCSVPEGAHFDPNEDPEFCACCDEVLCGPCWDAGHMRVMW